jgi:MFS family permease
VFIQYFKTTSKTTKIIFCIYLIQSIVTGVNYLISMYYASTVQYATKQVAIGWFVGASAIGSVACNYLLRNHIGLHPKKIFSGSLFAQAAALIMVMISTNVPSILLSMFLLGGSGTVFISVLSFITLVENSSSKLRTDQTIKAQYMISNTGMAIGFILVGFCSVGYFYYIFSSLSVVLLLLSLLSSKLITTSFQTKEQCKSKDSLQTQPNYYYAWYGLILIFLVNFMFAQHRLAYPEVLQIAYGGKTAGYLSVLNPFFIVLLNIYALNRLAYFDQKQLATAGVFLVGVSGALFLFKVNIICVILACLVFSLGEAVSFNASQYLCYAYVDNEKRATYISYFRSAIALGSIFGGPVAGYMVSEYQFSSIWREFLIISLVSILSYYLLKSKTISN